MEENKNNAIEKTENLSEKPSAKNARGKSKNTKKNNVKKSKKPSQDKKAQIREQKAEEKHKRRLEKKKAQAEKRKAMLAKKEELKKERLKRRSELKKAKLLKKQERENKKAELKNLKLQKQAERAQRKAYLKHETASERKNRIAKEKQAKLALRKEKLENKRAKRQERLEERKHRRALRSQERREKRNRGVGGWLAAVISLGSVVLILGSLLTLTYFTPLDDYMMTNTAEERSFYDLVGYVDNLDVNLSKLVVTKDSEKQQKLLSEVRVQSNLASSSISMLAIEDENKFYTSKFINQVGDFAKYLESKLIDGENLSKSDYETLYAMHQINGELKGKLNELINEINEDFNFSSIYEGKEDNLLISKFNELESNATNYPHMIYDGAFSDSVKKQESKFLNTFEKVSKAEAEENFKKYFKDYNVSDVELVGEAISEKIECYDFEGKTQDGTLLTAQISKKGGKLILFTHYKDCTNTVYEPKKLEEVAMRFLENAGYKNMQAVWMAEGNNVTSFNFASVTDGIICYSDLIKVNVCNERGTVSGIEASAYALNHIPRTISKAKIGLSEAKVKVEDEIEVETSRIALIPYGSQEKLAYEFTGVKNGETYYIYVDAVSGKELEIFKVVKTTEGTLLL